ncbi:MAG: hypothetical protein HQM11_08010 [SAR324 cluster bacterium]|nr:hypothetical protein [SAR324 cluster bacterium]
MEVLQRFSEQERDYLLYEARLDAVRDERARNKLYETTARQLAEALQRESVALQREALAQQQKEQLLELLKKAGIDPNL